MLAILGLFGFAVATIMMTADDLDDSADEAAGTLSDTDDNLETLPLDQVFNLDPGEFAGSDDAEFLQGSDQFDKIDGRGGDDWIDGGDGNDSVIGGLGDDTLFGSSGDDTVLGHVGDDTLFGGIGNDQMIGGSGEDLMFGDDGDDTLLGSLGDDALFGGAGADILNAGAGDDQLFGGDDLVRDYLNGSDGEDALFGGQGDNLNGGKGADRFVLTDDADAQVDDFNPAEDVIEVVYAAGDVPPVLSLQSGDGVTVLLADGAVVAEFAGSPDIDLGLVRLVPDTGA